MAAVGASPAPEPIDPKPDMAGPDNPSSSLQETPSTAPNSTTIPDQNPSSIENSTSKQNPNHSVPAFTPIPQMVPPFAPSFRPLGAPQFAAVPSPNPNFPMGQSTLVQPPGVANSNLNGSAVASVPSPGMRPVGMYQPLPGQPHVSVQLQYGQQVPNAAVQTPGAIPPPGVPRIPIPFPGMIRPGFAPRPIPLVRPIPGIRPGPTPPIVTPMLRPIAPVPLVEKPQTTVYVGKIALTVDNDFLLSLLKLCGPVKSWKRAQDPSNGTPKGFGFCEFEAAEGILRAVRLLSKLNVDGQELVLNINQATRDYLDKYVARKKEREKLKETEALLGDLAAEGIAQHPTENDASKPAVEVPKKESGSPDNKEEAQDENRTFGIVNDDDRAADKEVMEMITKMLEERAKTLPPPPPPPTETPANISDKSHSEVTSKSRDRDDADAAKSDAAGYKTNEDAANENKTANEADKPEASSPDKGSRSRRERSRERDREKDRDVDLKRERDREADRYEREKERDRIKREREREERMRQSERLLKDRLKDWENRERDREYQRHHEREREKDRDRERRREVSKQEDDSDDDIDLRKRRRRGGMVEDRKRKRQREKDEDITDRLREEEELAEEARKRELEEEKRKEEEKAASARAMDMFMQDMVSEIASMKQQEATIDHMQVDGEKDNGNVGNGIDAGDGLHWNNHGLNNEQSMELDVRQNTIPPTKRLGFGLFGLGRRTSVPSVFRAEEDEDVEEKKMRPLVPIDYSAEELQAVQNDTTEAPPNIAAATEFAKRISGANPKEEKLRSGDRSSHREREKDREEKQPKSETKKVLDAKQLIDMIPRTKEELFAYEVNWTIYDKHELHERMRPWVSKKITEFLGEEEETLVEYIVSCTKDHVEASKMLELLQAILDDEAEMFVLKMWRMLIFEIMKVETGLSVKSRS
ncbi:RNA-binding protein 25 [Rhynchospora pubera]|uniref:RNA-binding protein 25 n=1 Tax=Rhynchospora pubera TaxID=906938 RepID=A0AAV8H4J0_9POAL|nr:RNA-binding protein 25 [Rhynchospora pubera]